MTNLTEGQKAPDFKTKDQNGNVVSLKDFLGKKVALYFYPEDDTPTCTIEACNLRDNYEELKNAGIVILGVSPDDKIKHKKFEEKYVLPFILLEDPEKKIIDQYGVWGEKNLYGRKYMGLYRTTFLIDEYGIIFKIFRKPRSKIHSEEILKAASQLQKVK
ncbi:MAG: thioredoxin-dependent thiol peroxidase [Bacteroidota bacterium]|nr:thioredoxin-dependent thiol peroxidase [Bacteroidota bacterium]